MENKIVCVVFLALINVCVLTAFSQTFSSEVWHEGQVVLLDGDTLKGEVMYNMENQTVQYSDGNTILAYSPRKLLAFEIYDNLIDMHRTFYVLPYSTDNNYEAPFIFELSYEGPHLSLLRTEKVASVMRNVPYMYATYTYEELQYTYYFIDKTGRILEFKGRKSDLLAILDDRENDMREYLKRNNLNMNRLDHLIKICSYYNSLFNL